MGYRRFRRPLTPVARRSSPGENRVGAQVGSLRKTGRAGLGWIPRVKESHYAYLLYLLTYLLYFTLLTYWNEIVICAQVGSLKKTGRAGLGWIPRVKESHYAYLLYLHTYLLYLPTGTKS